MSKIKRESDEHGDIVQGTFTDAYRNMTYKHVMGLKWAAHYCPVAKYVLKTDDDMFMNSKEMKKFLSKELSPWGAKGLIACQALRDSPVHRSASKWTVSEKEYHGVYYPTFCAGWAVLYSQDVVSKLLEAAEEAPYFWIDDLHITGIIAYKLGIDRTPINSLILEQEDLEALDKGKEIDKKFLFGPIQLSTARMLQLWNRFPA